MEITKQKVRELYEKHSKYYDLTAFLDKIFLGNKRKYLLSKAYGKVLEVGAGTGRNLPLYNEKCDVTAVDLTSAMLEVAKKRAAKLNRKVKSFLLKMMHLTQLSILWYYALILILFKH